MSIWTYKDRWYVRVVHKGATYRGRRGFPTKDAALEEQVRIKLKLKSTRFSKDTPNITAPLFGTLWGIYLERCEAYHGKHWYQTKIYIGRKYFEKWFLLPIEQVYPADIESHLISRKQVSARTSNLDFQILHNFFKWCVDMEYLEKHPMRSLKKFSYKAGEKTIPTKEEVDRIIDTAEGEDRLLILFLASTMARISEILRLEWNNIDMEHQMLSLKTCKTRDGGEKERKIPINGRLLNELVKFSGTREGLIFRGCGTSYQAALDRFMQYVKSAGVQSISGFHQLRHYGISRLVEAGVDLATIRDLAGHSTLNITGVYSHSSIESKRKAIGVLTSG